LFGVAKKLLSALLTAGTLLSATIMGQSGSNVVILENDLRTAQQWKIREANQKQLGLEAFMRDNPTLSINEARDAMYYLLPLPVDHYELTVEGRYIDSTIETAETYLTDEAIWKKFFWKSFDQLPGTINKYALDRIFNKYGCAADMSVHIDASLREQIPEPVIIANLLKKIQYWTQHWNPDASQERLEEITDRTIAILLQESFATGQAQGDDLGPFQISSETVRSIKKHPEFRKYEQDDFYNWDVSAKAGTYWFSQCLKDADGNVDLATGAYNAGIIDAKKGTLRARVYTNSVRDRQARYVFNTQSPTWKRILDESGVRTTLDRAFDRALSEYVKTKQVQSDSF